MGVRDGRTRSHSRIRELARWAYNHRRRKHRPRRVAQVSKWGEAGGASSDRPIAEKAEVKKIGRVLLEAVLQGFEALLSRRW
jgi:hypothetical protein